MIPLLVALGAVAGELPLDDPEGPPPAPEVGAAPGQVRAFGGIGAAVEEGGGVALVGTLELLTIAYVGVRVTGLVTVPVAAEAPGWSALRLGPSLHLLPYRALDLSLFAEGGVGALDLFSGARVFLPVVAGGLTLELWPLHWLVLRGELALQVGTADRGGRAETRLTPFGTLGLGIGL